MRAGDVGELQNETPLSADHPCKGATHMEQEGQTRPRRDTSPPLTVSPHTPWLLLITHIPAIDLLLISLSLYLFWRQGLAYLRLIWLCS